MKKVAVLTGNTSPDLSVFKELSKWGKIDIYVNREKDYIEERDHVTYLSFLDWKEDEYDANIVINSLAPFMDCYMTGDIYIWLQAMPDYSWRTATLGPAFLQNIVPLVKTWITSLPTEGLNNVLDIKTVDEWKKLLGLNFEMEYKEDVDPEITKRQNSSYVLHPSKLLGDEQI